MASKLTGFRVPAKEGGLKSVIPDDARSGYNNANPIISNRRQM